MSVILGINAFHAGASAAVLIDGKPLVAIAEERLNRIKYYARFPAQAIAKCLQLAGINYRDIDAVALGRDPSANRGKKAMFALRHLADFANLARLKGSRNILNDLRSLISTECGVDAGELRFQQYNVEHHLAHTASAYFISEWDKAAGLSVDGSGDFVSCMLTDCAGSDITVQQRIFLPHSLGLLYTMICQFIGYTKYGDEGKVMGLAPLGVDTYKRHFNDMLSLEENGIGLNSKYFVPFNSNQGLVINEAGEMEIDRQYSDELVRIFGEPRKPHTEITQRDKDLAFGLQRVFEQGYLHLLRILHKLVRVDRLVLSGGCALNSVANGKVFDETPFRLTCIQPASGDEGLALGAALYVSNSIFKEPRQAANCSAYLGPEFSDSEIRAELERNDVPFSECGGECLLRETVEEIANGKVVGWFQGKMEWGPRALGNRSILAHPGLDDMKDTLNARIKHREWFRPFAPSVLVERQAEIFEHSHPSPHMLHVYKIRPEWRKRLVAVNHVDDTGRLQTVARHENPLYYDLIKAFEARTGIPVLLNTSFNENEPIVCNPSEAIACFLRTKMDVLVIGRFVCRK